VTRWIVSTGSAKLAFGLLAVSCGVLLYAHEAHAVLGATQDTIQADQIRFRGVRRQHTDWQMTTHEISLADGSGIKEYVNAAGLVFAVSWRTRLKPNLETLLGAQYVAAPATSAGAPNGVTSLKRQQSLRRPNLVVHQGGRMNAFAGVAYIPSLVPNGVNADALR
jgi:hypothetical protein